MRSLLIAIVCAGLMACAGQGPAAESASGNTAASAAEQEATEVAQRYLERMMALDAPGCAALMHPEALAQLRALFTPLFEMEGGTEALQIFAGIDTLEAFQQASDTEIFAAFLKGAAFSNPDLAEIMRTSKNRILGVVLEGDDMAHVVYRTEMVVAGASASTVDSMSMRRGPDGFRLEMSGDLEQVAQQLRAALAAGIGSDSE